MKRNAEYALNPVFVSEDGQHIDLIVKFVEFPMELPFTASANDIEEHGRDLHRRALNGEFGPIGAYVPPLPNPEGQPQPISTGAQTL